MSVVGRDKVVIRLSGNTEQDRETRAAFAAETDEEECQAKTGVRRQLYSPHTEEFARPEPRGPGTKIHCCRGVESCCGVKVTS